MDLLNIDASGGELSPTLLRNLDALARVSPDTAERVRLATPRYDVEVTPSDEPELAVVAGGRALTSRRRPGTEAKRLAESVDPHESAIVCVLGFGAGHHARALVDRLGTISRVICFEPDAGLLRAVLDRVDHADLLATGRLVILTDPEDRAAIGRSLEGVEGLIALGVKIVEHPASRARLGTTADVFTSRFTEVVTSLKSVIATTLSQPGITLRNLLMNADAYAACDGILPLAGAAAGRPAVVVSAGPSLARNLDRLADPGVRERVVIVAVQTVLKTMLARGIRPHFVCALDHHEISRRFYEGLTADDVRGVTLIADPKVNPAVLEAWPGALRMTRNDLLDDLLGADAGAPKGEVKPGATVAHLCHYVARYLGADPVILIGQDLGFTDGQYYASGAAIHDVWAGELGAFCTLESMEWYRIARMKRTLRRCTDVLGRPIFTDDQMASYLGQFEVDFAADTARGLRTIDATEGGVAKQHTTALPLSEALARCAGTAALSLPAPARVDLAAAAPRTIARVQSVRAQMHLIAERSRETHDLLAQMLDHHHDQARVNALIGRVQAIGEGVRAVSPGWSMIRFLNQLGTLDRVRADRGIELDTGLNDMERQRRRIERDMANVERIAQAADYLRDLLTRTERAIAGAEPRLTRETPEPERVQAARDAGRVEALIYADPRVNGLGVERDLGREVALGRNALQMTVERLLRARLLDGITVLTGEPDRVRALLGDLAGLVDVERVDAERVRARLRSVGRARLFGAASWRGGIGGLTAADETFEARTSHDIVQKRNLHAAVLVGADWSIIDPEIVDAVIGRWREDPEGNRVVFTQAVPGAAPTLLDRDALARLAEACARAGAIASVGGLLGYLPSSPQHDPIATRLCVPIPMIVRDAGVRLIADTTPGRARISAVVRSMGEAWVEASADRIARKAREYGTDPTPQQLELELCTGRLASGAWGSWIRGADEGPERPVLSLPAAHRILKQLAESREDGAVTLGGVGDPLMHDRALDIVTMACELGVGAVHVRTELVRDSVDLDALVGCGAAVISVDVLADRDDTYRALTGVDRLGVVRDRMVGLIERSRARAEGELPTPWIVARITRCDEVYEELPDFVDRWLSACGAVQVDALPRRVRGARIAPLAVPRGARERFLRERMTILSDGSCLNGAGVLIREADALSEHLAEVWRRAHRARKEQAVAA